MNAIERNILGFVRLRQMMFMIAPSTEDICECVKGADRHSVQGLWIDGKINLSQPRKPKSKRRWVMGQDDDDDEPAHSS